MRSSLFSDMLFFMEGKFIRFLIFVLHFFKKIARQTIEDVTVRHVVMGNL